MQKTPDAAALLDVLFEQASIVNELDGPQIEAWVSGLFPVFDDQVTAMTFVDHCAATATDQGALVVAAIAELAAGLDPETAAHATHVLLDALPDAGLGIAKSELSGAWSVTARFGRSIVLGFDNSASADSLSDVASPSEVPSPISERSAPSDADSGDEEPRDIAVETGDLRHSILVELGDEGLVTDLQLTGPAKLLLEEVVASDDRVVVVEMVVAEAVAEIAEAWPVADAPEHAFGAGFEANQQFARRRMFVVSGQVLPVVRAIEAAVDIRRGLDDAEYANANRAALSTLQAAVGLPDSAPDNSDFDAHVAAWVAVIRGDVADVAPRERDALVWLEWADWLGAGIGLLRAGAGTAADGSTLVDHVNRCPEVSSSIDKADREYAEWAFDVALDLLQDQGVITEDRLLTAEGHASLRHGLVAAWTAEQTAI